MARDNNLPLARALAPRPAAARRPRRCRPCSSARWPPSAARRQHRPAARHRDPLLGGDRLGQPGLPAGDRADAGRPPARTLDGRSARSCRRRPAVLAGPARAAGQRDRRRPGGCWSCSTSRGRARRSTGPGRLEPVRARRCGRSAWSSRAACITRSSGGGRAAETLARASRRITDRAGRGRAGDS